MGLDAIIIADAGTESFSGTSALRLYIDGQLASIQNIMRRVAPDQAPIDETTMTWASAPKLNGLFLYSFLREHGMTAELVNNYTADKERFLEYAASKPMTVIISTTFIMKKKDVHDLVADIRTVLPDAYIIVGGPFIYNCYLYREREKMEPGYLPPHLTNIGFFGEISEEPDADIYIVDLHGEDILLDILEKLRTGEKGYFPINCAKLQNGAYVFSDRRDSQDAGPAARRINWDLLPDSVFKSGVVSMQASHGCPYHCAFCDHMKGPRALYLVPVDELIEDMKKIQARGVKYVWFVDDNFRLGKPDLNEVCRRIIRENIDLRWMSFVRANTFEKIDAALLKQAGCVEVQLGLESGDIQQLININKQATPEMYYAVVDNLMRHGINCSVYFLFGFPGETVESVKRTQDFIKSIEFPDYPGALTWSFFPFVLVPLSPAYEKDMREKFGITGYFQEWKHNTMDFNSAVGHLFATFMGIENSSILYRQDNQDLYLSLSVEQRKSFIRLRHASAKKALEQKLDIGGMLKEMKDILAN